jgi:hypothetical protein
MPELVKLLELAREHIAAYRVGISPVEAEEAQFRASLTDEQRTAYQRLLIKQVTSEAMRLEAILLVLRVLVEHHGGALEWACTHVAEIVDIEDVYFLREPIDLANGWPRGYDDLAG